MVRTEQVKLPAGVCFLLGRVAEGIGDPAASLPGEMASRFCRPSDLVPADWDALPGLIRHHRLELQIDAWLNSCSASLPDAMSLSQHRGLKAVRRRAVLRTMRLVDETARLARRFAEEGVEMLVLKGAALSVQLYSTPLRRSSRDIDLLVRPQDEARARAILAGCGYGTSADAVFPCLNAVELRHADYDDMAVELHVRLADDDRLLPTRTLRPFETAAVVEIAGQPVRTLEPNAALAYAAYHGAHHHWFRLHWLADIAAAARSPRFDWDAAAAIAARTGTRRHLFLAARLSADLLGCPPSGLPGPVGRDLAAVRRSEAVVRRILANPPAKDAETVRQVGRLRILSAELALCQRPGAVWAQLLSRLRPTDTDRAAFPLPPALGSLHYPLRILRMAWVMWRLARHRPG